MIQQAALATRELVARELGVSERRLRTVQTICADAPDLAAQVMSGALPLLVAQTQVQRRLALANLAIRAPALLPSGPDVCDGDFRELGAAGRRSNSRRARSPTAYAVS